MIKNTKNDRTGTKGNTKTNNIIEKGDKAKILFPLASNEEFGQHRITEKTFTTN